MSKYRRNGRLSLSRTQLAGVTFASVVAAALAFTLGMCVPSSDASGGNASNQQRLSDAAHGRGKKAKPIVVASTTATPEPATSPVSASTVISTATAVLPFPTSTQASQVASPTATQPQTAATPVPTVPSVSGNPSSGFVVGEADHLTLNGLPFKFVGVNRYNLLTVGGSPYEGCGGVFSLAELDQWFSELRSLGPRVAVRFWVFQSFTRSGTDFTRLDAVVALAQKYGIYLIPVFENQWADCNPEGYKYDTWYASSYTQPFGGDPISYLDYIGRVVPRYRGNPQILAWQLMNEAENKTTTGACGSFATFDAFVGSVSDYVRSLDANHLISFGTMGSGQCGAVNSTTQYQQLHSHPNISIVEAHDYDHDSTALPSYLQTDLGVAQALNKPFFVGEAGVKAGSSCPLTPQGRAGDFAAKIGAAFSDGTDGYVIWSYRDANEAPPLCSYDFLLGDPLVAVLASVATQ